MIDDFLLISLIMPCYNVEKYVAQCLDSIYNQDISETLYEVICVNDCSPDGTRNIILEYQKKHSNLILIDHLVNKKLGVARNTGRSKARGKYLWNIDSDDYIKPNCLKTLIEICEKNELDILMFNHVFFKNNIEIENTDYPFPNSNSLSGIDFLNKYCLNSFSEISPVWIQIYNVEFLNKNNIYSPEINMGEDGPYTYKSLLSAKRVMSITKSCYAYRANENSLSSMVEKKTTAIDLYEKCFLFTMYVSQLIILIPAEEKDIVSKFESICKYSTSLFPGYLILMNSSELRKFRKLCIINSIIIKSLLKWINRKNKIILFTVFLLPFVNQKIIKWFINQLK